jgi:hypothetical protein
MSVGFIPTLSAQFQGKRGLIFACERSVGVLAVFELDHRLMLLEPFKTWHKGNFAQSPAFNCMAACTLGFGNECGGAACAVQLRFRTRHRRQRVGLV